MAEDAVSCEGIGKDFRSPRGLGALLRGRPATVTRALEGVTVAVAPGEGLAVLGKNGAGKSTLLRLLAGLLRPSRGRGVVAGCDVAAGGARLRAAAAYVAADPRSFSWRLSGRDNLRFFAALHGLGGAAAGERVEAALGRVGLAAAAARRVEEYSAGMRQRLALARALLGEPRVLLLDEPTSGLDARAAAETLALVAERRAAGAAVVLASHHLEEALAACPRALVLDGGRVAYLGPSAGAREAALA